MVRGGRPLAQRITNGGQAVKKNELTPGFPEEGDAVGVIAKDVGAVVAAIEGMIDETVIDGARWASPGSEDNEWWTSRQEK